jgi:hypothetical protein
MIDHLTNRIQKPKKPQTTDPTNQKWATFTYFNPEIRKITNIFRNTKLRIAFRPINTLSKYFTHTKTTTKDLQKSGVYEKIPRPIVKVKHNAKVYIPKCAST